MSTSPSHPSSINPWQNYQQRHYPQQNPQQNPQRPPHSPYTENRVDTYRPYVDGDFDGESPYNANNHFDGDDTQFDGELNNNFDHDVNHNVSRDFNLDFNDNFHYNINDHFNGDDTQFDGDDADFDGDQYNGQYTDQYAHDIRNHLVDEHGNTFQSQRPSPALETYAHYFDQPREKDLYMTTHVTPPTFSTPHPDTPYNTEKETHQLFDHKEVIDPSNPSFYNDISPDVINTGLAGFSRTQPGDHPGRAGGGPEATTRGNHEDTVSHTQTSHTQDGVPNTTPDDDFDDFYTSIHHGPELGG